MELIKAGDMAPDFKLMDQHEKNFQLSRYRGKIVLLSWHPQAWTSVCTDQMRSLEANWNRFEKLNTVPVGLSTDTAPSKRAWACALSIENVRLLCDFWPHGQVAQHYGIFDPKYGTSKRVNIIVDVNGQVAWVKVYPPSQLPNIEEVFEFLKKQG
jgi:peroxiredoxin